MRISFHESPWEEVQLYLKFCVINCLSLTVLISSRSPYKKFRTLNFHQIPKRKGPLYISVHRRSSLSHAAIADEYAQPDAVGKPNSRLSRHGVSFDRVLAYGLGRSFGRRRPIRRFDEQIEDGIQQSQRQQNRRA